MWQLVRVSLGLCLVLWLCGCGAQRPKIGTASGKITYKGQPLNGAALMLYHTAGDAKNAVPITVPVTQKGEFSIIEVPPGEYKIVVEGTTGSVKAPLPRNLP